MRDELLIAFFTTIGLSSRFETLLKGGAQLGILLVLAAFYLAIQNGTGVAVATLAGLDRLGVQLPTFVSCLFAGILVTNLVPMMPPKVDMPKPEHSRSLALISDLSLGLFLAISLMSLQLWTLADLGFAILLMLVAQVVIVLLWAGIVVFRAMGATYDAAVMSSGYVGLALGATPTAIANMTAVTKLYGPSPRSFIVVPLIGAFFIDLANAIVIQLYVGWLA